MFQHLIKIAKLELNVYVENDRVTTIPTKITGELNLSRYNAENQQKWQIGVASEDYDHVKTPDIMQEKVLSLIDEYSNHDNHFFIYYPTPLVHGPLLPSEKDLKKSGIGIYGDFVLQVDRYVGEIVDSLKSKNIFDDTMIIFTSDNGASAVANFPYLLSIGHNPSNGLRGKKAEIWEGGNTKPNIITYPRIIKSGSESKGLIRHTDFFWTLSYILSNKLEDNTEEDSYSNLEVLKGNKDTVREFIVYSSGNILKMVDQLQVRFKKMNLNCLKKIGNK
ncbi:sulfatase-like hydrolase/transferase [Helcococcus bovis]|uniref:sulfatase-like hydrolase/transferase n=1 Tax=Helcococcus bovis TaxID=3153252 RepID=UPI0038BBB89D